MSKKKLILLKIKPIDEPQVCFRYLPSVNFPKALVKTDSVGREQLSKTKIHPFITTSFNGPKES